MKKQILSVMALAAMFTASSCSNYTQVVSVSPTSEGIAKVEGNFYQYENEDLRVRYSFWGEHGIMGFVIYNKTDHPIYIDWKKSNMINASKQLPYYTNKTTSNFTSYGNTYGSSWLSIFNGSAWGVSGTSTRTFGTETIVKPERVTFISPNSYVANAFYNLVSNIYFDIKNAHTEETKVDGNKMYVSTSDYDINFRNYLTYSDKEDFETEKHIDNGFKVSKVYTMKNQYSVNGNWKRPSRFYITKLEHDKLFYEDAPKL